jgi:hypothetical protein
MQDSNCLIMSVFPMDCHAFGILSDLRSERTGCPVRIGAGVAPHRIHEPKEIAPFLPPRSGNSS